MESASLRRRRILVIEDEFLIAEDLEARLQDIGAVVVGPAPSVERALELIHSERRIDAALVDVNLRGKLAYDVIDELTARRIPFVLMSGYEDHVLRRRYPHARNCEKPYKFADLEKALSAVVAGAA